MRALRAIRRSGSPGATASEHTLEQRDEQGRCHQVGGGPGFSALPGSRSDASKLRSARRPAAVRTPPAASTSRAPADTRAAASAPRLRAISVSGRGVEQPQVQLDDRLALAEPVAQRGDERRDPGLEGQGEVAHVLRGDRSRARRRSPWPRAGPRSARSARRARRARRRPPAPARRIAAYAARASATSSAPSVAASRSRSGPPASAALRQRSEQQRDPEVRVRLRRAARRLHDRQDRVAHAALARARQLGADRDRAAQHVLVGGVVEVVAGRDVARLLGADLEHARQLRGTGDGIGGTNGRRTGMCGRPPAARLTPLGARS